MRKLVAKPFILARVALPPWQKSFEVLGGRGFGQFGEQMRKVRIRLQIAGLGGFNERIQARAGGGARPCLAREPVFASNPPGDILCE